MPSSAIPWALGPWAQENNFGRPGLWAHGENSKGVLPLSAASGEQGGRGKGRAQKSKGTEKEGPAKGKARKGKGPEKEGPRTGRGYKRKSIQKERPREKELTMLMRRLHVYKFGARIKAPQQQLHPCGACFAQFVFEGEAVYCQRASC